MVVALLTWNSSLYEMKSKKIRHNTYCNENVNKFQQEIVYYKAFFELHDIETQYIEISYFKTILENYFFK